MTGLMCTSKTSGTVDSESSGHAAKVRPVDDRDDFEGLGKLDVEPSDIMLRLSLDRQRPCLNKNK